MKTNPAPISFPTCARRPGNRGARRWLGGWLALLVFLGAHSPLGPGLTALMGSLDPNHQLRVESAEQGLRLVLHHGLNCCGHHHGAAARALSLFEEPPSPANPDHIIQFHSAANYARPAVLAAHAPAGVERPAIAQLAPEPPRDPEEAPAAVSPHPPPNEQGCLLCLRSTLLLI